MSDNREKTASIGEDEGAEEVNDIITLNDENGNEVEFVCLDVIEYKGDDYIVLIPADEENGDVLILRAVPGDEDDEDVELVSVYDDSIVDKVYELFREKYKDDIK